jgi:Protein of unknown function (DUF3604)
MIGSSGLAAVRTRENKREALWDAMKRKETFATTGTRLRVRVFGGWDFTGSDLTRSGFAKYGYDNGVPMGGDLKAAPRGRTPALLIRAAHFLARRLKNVKTFASERKADNTRSSDPI